VFTFKIPGVAVPMACGCFVGTSFDPLTSTEKCILGPGVDSSSLQDDKLTKGTLPLM
jgi:hypothetical protein